MCNKIPTGASNKFDEFFRWSRLDKDFWWIPRNQKKQFCGERMAFSLQTSAGLFPKTVGIGIALKFLLKGINSFCLLKKNYHKESIRHSHSESTHPGAKVAPVSLNLRPSAISEVPLPARPEVVQLQDGAGALPRLPPLPQGPRRHGEQGGLARRAAALRRLRQELPVQGPRLTQAGTAHRLLRMGQLVARPVKCVPSLLLASTQSVIQLTNANDYSFLSLSATLKKCQKIFTKLSVPL